MPRMLWVINPASVCGVAMLTQLTINQFTVVETLEAEFSGGLTVITGETGAGKSIMIDALGLCLGDRADASAIRPGQDRADITATFDISALKAAQTWLGDHDLNHADDGECLLRRVLTREGRSRAYINGRPVTLQDLAALGALLVDIHGQHAHQALLRRAHQRQLLDSYGGHQDALAKVADLARQWQTLHQTLTDLRNAQQERTDREQLLRYQVRELDELSLGAAELPGLEDEQRSLANAETMQAQAGRALELCEENASSVRAALKELDPELHRGKTLDGVREMLQSAAIQLDEARGELQQHFADCESNPERLDEVQERLDTVYALARKHRVDPDALGDLHKELQDELSQLDSSDERLAELDTQLEALNQQYQRAAATLSKGRSKTAARLEKAVAALLKRLSMSNCRFRVALVPRESSQPHVRGAEDPEMLISTNPAADPQPLGRIASGGELSRISLAIQVATAGKATVPCMIFDEVDVGIGGAVAEVVGRLLADMATKTQVLCVTHLPQVASQGQQHLRVAKSGNGKTVSSRLEVLDEENRVEEVARMLGGLKLTDNTLAHAREMLLDGGMAS